MVFLSYGLKIIIGRDLLSQFKEIKIQFGDPLQLQLGELPVGAVDFGNQPRVATMKENAIVPGLSAKQVTVKISPMESGEVLVLMPTKHY